MRQPRRPCNMRPMHVERFAPSPTGRLHLGHAFSALLGAEAARAAGGIWRLRIEDLDQGRARPEYEAGIFEDLAWLGLDWPRPVMRQSERGAAYAAALARLDAMGLVYRCRCTRRDVEAAIAAPQEGGPDGPVYPGTCRNASVGPDEPAAIRLRMDRAVEAAGPLSFAEVGRGPAGETGEIAVDPAWLVEACGDVVLARKDAPASYHLAVVVDDAAERVTHVTRGEDLFAAAPIHRLLQALLDFPVPVWRHHRLIRDASGRRLAKRADDVALAKLREDGATPADVRRMVGL
ncbi:MAG: tRNA glutamyl-Q(34) synthetase GluQRS [Pseudomonadota bacterium]